MVGWWECGWHWLPVVRCITARQLLFLLPLLRMGPRLSGSSSSSSSSSSSASSSSSSSSASESSSSSSSTSSAPPRRGRSASVSNISEAAPARASARRVRDTQVSLSQSALALESAAAPQRHATRYAASSTEYRCLFCPRTAPLHNGTKAIADHMRIQHTASTPSAAELLAIDCAICEHCNGVRGNGRSLSAHKARCSSTRSSTTGSSNTISTTSGSSSTSSSTSSISSSTASGTSSSGKREGKERERQGAPSSSPPPPSAPASAAVSSSRIAQYVDPVAIAERVPLACGALIPHDTWHLACILSHLAIDSRCPVCRAQQAGATIGPRK